MDKGLLVKILVVFLAMLFLLEPFAMTAQEWARGKAGDPSERYVGAANVNATI